MSFLDFLKYAYIQTKITHNFTENEYGDINLTYGCNCNMYSIAYILFQIYCY